MATHSSILPEEFRGQRSLAGYSPWGHKESDTTEQLSLFTTLLLRISLWERDYYPRTLASVWFSQLTG